MARVKKESNLAAKLSISILGVLVLLFAATAGHAWNLKSAAVASVQKRAAAAKNQAPPKQLGDAALSKMPLVFEPNVGQTDSRAKFIARSSSYAAFLTGPTQAVLKIRNSADSDDVVSMNLAGANANAKGGATEKTAGVSHYYIGDYSQRHESIPNYLKVQYNDVYPKIDVVYQGDNSRFRYDFMVNPGADPKAIRMNFGGAQSVKLDPKGSLLLTVANNDYYMSSKPVIYQEFAGKKHFVDGVYKMNGNDVGFELGSYDPSQTLVIDPQFTAGSYLGTTTAGIGSSHINSVANGGGSTFLTGYTVSVTFPTVIPAADVAAGGPLVTAGTYGGTGNDGDAFVTRINYAFSTAPTYSVYLGGASIDVGTGIGVDSNFNATVVGYTQSGFCTTAPPNGCFPTLLPIEPAPPSPILGQHIFVSKFSGSTGVLVNSSVIYGVGTEKAMGVAVQANGTAHITGSTSSTNLLTALGLTGAKLGAQTALGGTGSTNAFYLQLTVSGSSYAVGVGTYIGGFGFDQGNAIALDPCGNGATDCAGGTNSVLVVGTSNSFGPGPSPDNQFPCINSACLTTGRSTGQTHAFATQIATTTNASQTAGTFLNSFHIGSNANSEIGTSAAFDYGSSSINPASPQLTSLGNIYVGGAVSGAQWQTLPDTTPPNATFTDAPVAAGFRLDGAATQGAGAQDGFALGITPADRSYNGNIVLAGTVVNGDEVLGNGAGPNKPPAGSVSLVTGLTIDYLNQIYITGASSQASGEYDATTVFAAGPPDVLPAGHFVTDVAGDVMSTSAIVIRRRANAGTISITLGPPVIFGNFPGFDIVGGTPFLNDFAPQEQILSPVAIGPGTTGICTVAGASKTCYPEVTPLGDIPMGPGTTAPTAISGTAPNATIAIGQANGVSYDQATNNGCFGGFLSQEIPEPGKGAAGPPATYGSGTIYSVIQPTAYRNNANTLVGGGVADTGVVGCNTYNSDTIIEVGGQVNNNPSFTFTMPASQLSAIAPPSVSFTLANLDPNFPNPTFTLSPVLYTPFGFGPPILAPAALCNSPFGWLECSQNGDTETLTVGGPANGLDPGLYIARFTVTPDQGDNAHVPQLVTVYLNVKGVLLTNSAAGQGVPMSTSIPNDCTVSPAPMGATPISVQQCSFTVTNGPGGSVFDNGLAKEVINIPVLSLDLGVLPLPQSLIRFSASTGIGTTPASVGFAGDFLGDPAGSPEPTNAAGPNGVVGCPAGGGGTFIATTGACDIQITIDANTFAAVPNGQYTNTLALSVNGLFDPLWGAPETGEVAINAPIITFNVTVANNALLYLGPGTFSEFSSPACLAPGSATVINPCPGLTTISEVDTLDSINLATTTSVAYTASSAPAVGFLCAAGPATQGIPLASNPTNGGSGFNFGNNGDLPASNVGEPGTQIAYPVSVANPGIFPQGIYATTVTVTVPSVLQISGPSAGQPVQATRTYCLTVGTWISAAINTPDIPTGVPPLYIEAGTAQNQGNALQSFFNVTAFGSVVASPNAPGPIIAGLPAGNNPAGLGIPFTLTAAASNATNEPWLSLDTGGTCPGGGGVTLATFCLDSAPTLLTVAMEYDPSYNVAACSTVACFNAGTSALVVPPLAPGPSVPNSPPNPTNGGVGGTNVAENFVFRIYVTSGDSLQFYTDYSLFANCAVFPQGGGAVPPGPSEGNLVTSAQLTSETMSPYTTFPQAAPCPPGVNGGMNAFSIDPVDTTGQGGPDLPAGVTPYGPGVFIQYYTVAGTGVYTMQDGTPAGHDQLHELCPVGGFMWPCQYVYINTSGGFPASLPHVLPFFPAPGTFYNVTSVPFLLGAQPQLGGNCAFPAVPPIFPAGFDCMEETIIDRPIADSLAQGIYHESFYSAVVNSLPPFDIPQPPAMVYVDLNITGPPSVNLTPNPVSFTYNQKAAATVPASQAVLLTSSGPSAPIGFTITPQSGTATVLLNGSGAAINGCIVPGGLTDCRGHALTLTVTIGNLASLALGADGGQLAVNIPLTNPVTGFPNAPVTNPSFSIPVNVTVFSPPTITLTGSGTPPLPVAFNWTVGQPNVTIAAGSTNQVVVQLLGNDTYTITSNHPNWVAIDGAASVTNTATTGTHTITIIGENVAGGLPSNPPSGQDIATLTVTGSSGETSSTTVTVNVAQEPTVTIGSFSNPDNLIYYAGDTDASTPGTTSTITMSVTPTPENPSYTLTATIVYTPPSPSGYCAVAPNPVTVSNTAPATVTLTLTPAEAGFVPGNTYSCAITWDPAAVVPTTLTVNFNVQSQTLNNPGPITFNVPTSPTTTFTQNIAMTGEGTYMFNTTDQVVTPAGGSWLTTKSVQMTNTTGNGKGPSTGTMPVTVNDGGPLGTPPDTPGTYGGTIAYTGPVGFAIPFNTLVTMNVGTIGANPSSASWTYTIGFTTPAPVSIALSSLPAVGLTFSAAVSYTSGQPTGWITGCNVSGGNATPATLTIGYNPAGLAGTAAGTLYTGACTISTANSTATLAIPVNLLVTSMPTLSATIGGGNNPVVNVTGLINGPPVSYPSYTLTIVGNGLMPAGSTMPFTVTNVTSDPSWLSVTPLTGAVGSAGTNLLISVNMAALGASPLPGILDGSFVVSSPNSANSLTVSVILTTTHPSFFNGESLITGGGGFYTLGFFGTYAYFPTSLAIWHTTLGEELIFYTPGDNSDGIYFYDVDSTHIWYTNPSSYPNIYDFNVGSWLFYEGNGNTTKGSRQFYDYNSKTFIFE